MCTCFPILASLFQFQDVLLCRARNFDDKNRIEITLRCQVNHCDGSRASIRCALRLACGTECSTSGRNKAHELVWRKLGPKKQHYRTVEPRTAEAANGVGASSITLTVPLRFELSFAVLSDLLAVVNPPMLRRKGLGGGKTRKQPELRPASLGKRKGS